MLQLLPGPDGVVVVAVCDELMRRTHLLVQQSADIVNIVKIINIVNIVNIANIVNMVNVANIGNIVNIQGFEIPKYFEIQDFLTLWLGATFFSQITFSVVGRGPKWSNLPKFHKGGPCREQQEGKMTDQNR